MKTSRLYATRSWSLLNLKFIFIPLFMACLSEADLDWKMANPYPTNADLNIAAFNGSGRGFIIGWGRADTTNTVLAEILLTVDGGKAWREVSRGGIEGYFASGAFADERVGVAVGNNGAVIRTTDGGETWTTISLGSSKPHFTSICFFDALHGIAVGRAEEGWGGVVYRTENAGENWIADSALIDSLFLIKTKDTAFRSAACPDANTGIISSQTGTLLHTSNGGASWSGAVVENGGYLNVMTFLNARVGVAIGSTATYRSLDAGSSWSKVSTHENGNPQMVAFSDSLHGFAFFGNKYRRTVDGGKSWTEDMDFKEGYFNSLAFTGDDVGVMVGTGGRIIRTNDGGATWSWISQSPIQAKLRTVAFADSSTGVAMGTGGMLRTTNGGASWTKVDGPLGPYSDAKSISFSKKKVGIAVFSFFNPNCFRTLDGAATWSSVSLPAGIQINSAKLLDDNIGIGVGSECGESECQSVAVRSIDAGESWKVVGNFPKTFHPSSLSCTSNGVCVAYGSNGNYRSIDGGFAWGAIQMGSEQYNISSIAFADSLTGIALGSNQAEGNVILRTVDAGASWALVPVEPNNPANIESVSFSDSQKGIIAGGGSMLETRDGGITWNRVLLEFPIINLHGITNTGSGTWVAVGDNSTILVSGKTPIYNPGGTKVFSRSPSASTVPFFRVSGSDVFASSGKNRPWKQASASIYDLSGKKIRFSNASFSGTEFRLPTDRLGRGVYLAEVKDGNVFLRKKLYLSN